MSSHRQTRGLHGTRGTHTQAPQSVSNREAHASTTVKFKQSGLPAPSEHSDLALFHPSFPSTQSSELGAKHPLSENKNGVLIITIKPSISLSGCPVHSPSHLQLLQGGLFLPQLLPVFVKGDIKRADIRLDRGEVEPGRDGWNLFNRVGKIRWQR